MDLQSKTRFNKAPVITKRRTRFDLSHSILTTFDTGDFVPVFCEPVYPGETHSLRCSSLTRLETSLHQTMDNAYLEFAFFFVPTKTVWDNFDKFLGANDDPWTQTVEYHIPQIKLYTGADVVTPYSLLNHLMLPSSDYGWTDGDTTFGLEVDQIPLRCVYQVYNDWYRDENYDSIIYFSKGDDDIENLGSVSDNPLFNGSRFFPSRYNLKVNRFKDLFSTALPAPQKGQEVSINLGDVAPIVGASELHNVGNNFLQFLGSSALGSGYRDLVISNSGTLHYSDADPSTPGNPSAVRRTNMVADLSSASAVTINQLRLAIAAQAISERDARGGTRLKERTYATWGVHVNDLEIDRSEFLGGKRIPISMMEVLQTSETGVTVLGSDAGHSKTVDQSDSFIRSFTQYGWIVGFCYVRTSRSYSQGIDRKFRNKSLYDLYDPMLDNIGEVAVLKSELFALETTTADDVATANEVFGYQEAWYHLKERSNRFSGYFQPGISGTLDSWHYGDDYSDYPQASADWLKETPNNVDRTIAVQSNASFQWSANIYFEYYATREMAKYSIPNTFGF